MITMQNWHVHVPDDEQSIGYLGENLVFRLEILTDAPPDWVYRLDLKYGSGHKNFLLLNYTDGVLWVDISRDNLENGRLKAQIRALRDEQEKHSNMFDLIVFNSIQAVKEFEPSEPSAFEQLEQRLNQLQQNAEADAVRAEDAADRAEAAAEGRADHSTLNNRDAPDQHPIQSITGLDDILKTIPRPMTAEELRKILMGGT